MINKYTLPLSIIGGGITLSGIFCASTLILLKKLQQASEEAIVRASLELSKNDEILSFISSISNDLVERIVKRNKKLLMAAAFGSILGCGGMHLLIIIINF